MKVRWGIIGCGGISQNRTIPGLLKAENAVCTAVAEPNDERRSAIMEQFNIQNGYASVEEMLEKADIDAVYIATPVFCHKEQAMMAADAGKHILMEKPMGLTSVEAEEMKAYCEGKNVLLGVGFMMRFHEAHQQIKKLIDDGKLGEIVTAYAKFNCRSTPEEETLWRQSKERGGGGAVMDMGIYCIDLCRYLTNLKAKEVTAFCGNQIFTYIDVEDAGTAVLKMENGALFTVESNFNVSEEIGGCRFEIYGTEGSVTAELTIGQTETGTVTYRSLGTSDVVELKYKTGDLYTKEIEAFSNAVLSGSDAPVSAEEGILDQKIIEAIYKSNETGCHIEIV